MKYSLGLSALALAASVNAHSIMQRISVDGVDQGSLTGLRYPSSNNPVQDYTSPDLLCGAGSTKSDTVITIPAGSAVSGAWAHAIGGPQGSGDADNPIAASHHGPTQVYLAKVNDASTAAATGLDWFKIASDSVTAAGVWGVDNVVSSLSGGFGYQKFIMPDCIAPGQYLMRVELLALHSASSANGAQFYQSCAQIKVTGSGSFSPASSDSISLPGYSATDPGILANIYDSSIYTSYKAPGPAVISCGASSGAATTEAAVAPSAAPAKTSAAAPVASSAAAPVSSSVGVQPAATSAACTNEITVSAKPTTLSTIVKPAATTPASSGSGAAAKYAQCGGNGHTGPTSCAGGSTCKVVNDYYSQCL